MSDSLIPAPHGRLIVPHGTPLAQCPTSLPDTPEGWKQRLNAMGASNLEMDRDGCVVMDVLHFLAYPREELDEESGELKRYSWLVLISPDGHTFGTSSEPVAHQVARLLEAVNGGKLALPVGICIVERKSRKSGRTYHDMRII